ncbi:MAG: DUF1326 domain-containing protein [Gammaproteobacteria bacterium]|nr:DUF1326 domain-containing protein [Gammaproteobacteria bacterium]
MTAPTWSMSGQYMESCNCDYLCPCIYTNPQGEVTHDHCTALMVYRIDEGRFDATTLDGLKFALVIRSGKVMADGNWIFACVVEDTADDAQRVALNEILAGRAGGRPALIHDALVGDFRGIAFAPISFEMDGLDRETDVDGIFSFAISGVPSRTGSGEPITIDNTAHPANSRLALARSKEMHVHGFGLELDLSGVGNNGHFAPFAWSN